MKYCLLLTITLSLFSCETKQTPGDFKYKPPIPSSPKKTELKDLGTNRFKNFILTSKIGLSSDIPVHTKKITLTLGNPKEFGDILTTREQKFGKQIPLLFKESGADHISLSYKLSDCTQEIIDRKVIDESQAKSTSYQNISKNLKILINGKLYPLNTKVTEFKENKIVVHLDRLKVLENIEATSIEVQLSDIRKNEKVGLKRLKGKIEMRMLYLSGNSKMADRWYEDCTNIFHAALNNYHYGVSFSGKFKSVGHQGGYYIRELEISDKKFTGNQNLYDPTFIMSGLQEAFYNLFPDFHSQYEVIKKYKAYVKLEFI